MLWALAIGASGPTLAQINACTGFFYDPGGDGGPYTNNEHVTVTLCPEGGPGSGPATSVLFTHWDIAGPLDQLRVHDGPSVAAPLLATGSGLNSLIGQSFVSTDPSGCLTFDWQSDIVGTATGWIARITTAPSPGSNTSASVCTAAAPLSLLALLGGDPDPGGTWKDPGGAPHGDTFNAAVDAPGNWTYTQTGPATCSPASATLTVTKINAADAGEDADLTVCASDAPTSLFDALGGSPDPGGTWTGPGGGPHSDMFDPATDPPGAYTYTVTGISPCLPASATVTVTVNQPPNAGTNGAITVCSNAAAFSLFAQLGGTPDASGAWTGPGGGAVAAIYTPGTSTPGAYTYTVAGLSPCPPALATVTVTQTSAPNAGTDRSITVCSSDAPFSMSGQLNGTPDPGGTWVGPGGSHGNTFDPAVDAGGAYVYTVTGTAPCTNASATLNITVRTAPDAGTNATLALCSTDGVFALFNALGGTPDVGGTWRNPSNQPHSGNFIPGTSPTGAYTYTVAGIAPCGNASATVTVSVSTAPNAGTNATVTKCSTNGSFSMFAQLGGSPQSGGTWTDPGGVAHGNFFNPATDLPGPYTYTIIGASPCANATAVLTVVVNQPPDAGGNGSTTRCADSAPFDLFARLTGSPDATGSWTGPGGGSVSATFTPGVSAPGVYTYTVLGAAPCPNDQATVTVTIVNPPNPGTNGSITVCSSDAAVNLFGLLGGTPQSGGTWTRPNGTAHSGTYQPATDPAGNYTYTLVGAAPCTNRSAVVQVTRVIAPNAGTNGSTTVCTTNSPFPLINFLGGSPNGSGTWLDPSLAPTTGTFTPGTSQPGVYAYVVSGAAPCTNDTGFVTVNVNLQPNAGTNSSITVCDQEAPFQLIDILGGSPDAGGTWTRPNGMPSSGTFTPGTSQPGNYTYSLVASAPCVNVTAVLNVSVNEQPDAGNNDSVIRCSTDSPINLFNELGGNPDPGGSWMGPDGASSGTFIPGTSTPGAYTYTLIGAAPCVDDNATVDVMINQAPNAGGDGALTSCEDGPVINLFNGIVGPHDMTGTWEDTDATGQLSGFSFNPAGVSPGSYTFTYRVPANGQCGEDHARVEVTIVAALEAGSNSTTSACGNNNQVDLFNLLGGSPQAGGTWIDLDNTLALTGGIFNATLVTAPGAYHFKYMLAASGGCSADSAEVTLNVVAPPNAGTNNSITVCSNAPSFDMFPLLGAGAQSGGTWHVGAPNGPGHGAFYDPQVDAPNSFYYVKGGMAPCGSANARITVNEVTAPNAGNDAFITVCSNGAPFNMTSLLTGGPNPGGTWFFNNQNHGVQFVPGLDVQGVYEYRVPGTVPCGTDIATLTVSVTTGANAGCNSSITVCSGDDPFLLFNVLTCSPQNNGSWLGPDLEPHNGTYTPGSSVPGPYLYIVTGSSPCVNDTSTVTVFENPDPDAGTPGSGSFCGSAASPGGPVDLFTLLGGTPDPAGSWTGPAPANPPFSGTFTPGTSTPGTYTYTVNNSCGSASAQVTVTVNAPPNPGCNNSITRCSNGAPFDMTGQLGCSPAFGGQWSGPLPATTPVSPIFTPGTTAPGIYRYTVAGTGACTSLSAQLTIAVSLAPFAGCDASVSLCNTDAQLNLFTLLCAAQSGGAWFVNGVTPHSGILNPAVDVSGTYIYRVTGAPPCGIDEAAVVVQIFSAPNAGIDGLVEVCSDDPPFTLIDYISGGPQLNGNWTDPSGASHSGIYSPATSGPGLYKYRLPGSSGCGADSAYVTVFEYQEVYAGEDGQVQVCSDSAPFDLFGVLTGSPQSGGNWYDPDGLPFPGMYLPGSSEPGIYWYKLAGTAPCESDSARVTVFENQAPNAGISRLLSVCSTQDPFLMLDSLGGTPDANGTWTYGPDLHGPTFDPATDAEGAYVYTVSGVAPCTSTWAQVVITMTQAEDPGLAGSLPACVGADGINLFDGLEGTPTSGGLWSTLCPEGVLTNGVFDATGMTAGSSCTFTYVHPADGPCPASSAQVVLNVVDALEAGTDSSSQACRGSCVDLFTALGGTPQVGGYWVNVDGAPNLFGSVFCTAAVQAGTTWRFDHVLPASSSCEADTGRVTLTVLDGPFAGIDGGITVCSNSAPINMGTALSGGPDAGGSWFGPTWAPHGPNYVPATDSPGTYHYVVGGVGVCPADTADANIGEDPAPMAGTSAPLNICSSDASVDMFTLLGPNAQTGGQWTCVVCGGTPHSGVYNPAIDQPGIYQYTITASPPCSSVFALITVTEPQAPNAGCDNEITICSDQTSFSMRSQLGCSASPGGSWVFVTGGNTPHDDFFVPGTDLPGVYQYTLAGISPCTAASALLTVNVVEAPNAGESTTVNVCATSTTLVDILIELGPDAQGGGTWEDQNNSQALTGNLFDPTIAGIGTWPFVYTLPGTAPCSSASSTVTVVVGTGGSAGTDSAVVVCGSETAYDLFAGLGGDPTSGGTWADISGSGADLLNGILDVSDLPIGGSTPFVYTIDDPGCGSVSATVQVTATAYPDAGAGTDLILCSDGSPIDLFAQLTGTPDAGGAWTAPGGPHSSTFDPQVDTEGAYIYTVAGISPCADATATITITVNDPPDAGSDGSVLLCDTLTSFDLTTGLQGTPQPSGTWQDLNGSGGLSGGSLNTTGISPGTYAYLYTVDVVACGSASASVSVEVVTSVEVVDLERTCIERDRTYTVSFTIQDGQPATYTVTGLSGSISTTSPYVFTSDPLFTSETFEAFVQDQYGCGVVQLAGESPCTFEDEVFIPETFSPNGDGTNELFLIPGIEGYPDNSIVIYNRWGAKLYEAAGYDNATVVWDGTTDNGMAPAGTYFYVLELGDGSEAFTGYIYLNR